MEKSETIIEIVPAIIKVMGAVKSIEKSMTVGKGDSAYKGVPDAAVKEAIGAAMEANGLCIVPTSISAETTIERWNETYNGNEKVKQQVLERVNCKYLLMHTSGEWIEIAGRGHGTDSQDKAAGKATTYALKYALLYTFMIPTVKIDDADTTHSDSHDVPNSDLKWLNEGSEEFKTAIDYMKKTKDKVAGLKYIMSKFKVSKPMQEILKNAK